MNSLTNIFPLETEESLLKHYGDVGVNQKELILPYPHYYWENNQLIKSYLCHSKVHDSINKILTNVFDYYGSEEIHRLRLDIWGGCLYLRAIRGGTKFSTHSWGIAVDYDPINNQLDWGKDKALFASPDYENWWKFWEEEGWYSLGRQCNYDWMHIQAAVRH
jgi:hypothetical protein